MSHRLFSSLLVRRKKTKKDEKGRKKTKKDEKRRKNFFSQYKFYFGLKMILRRFPGGGGSSSSAVRRSARSRPRRSIPASVPSLSPPKRGSSLVQLGIGRFLFRPTTCWWLEPWSRAAAPRGRGGRCERTEPRGTAPRRSLRRSRGRGQAKAIKKRGRRCMPCWHGGSHQEDGGGN